MTTNSALPPTPKASRAPRRVDGLIPTGCKSITVIVPDHIYYHIQTQASLSCMAMPDYLFNFLREAIPLRDSSMQEGADKEPSPRQA